MALWQYQWRFYPRDISKSLLEERTSNFTLDHLDELDLWRNFDGTEKLTEQIGNILPKWKPWWKNMLVYWDTSLNDIQIYMGWTKIGSVLFRLDLNKLDKSILSWLLNLTEKFHLSLFDWNNLILEPNNKLFLESIVNSSAYKYVDNPEKFLNSFEH